MDNVSLLAQSQRGYMTAPAGCGKTHLIAEAVTKHANGRELILTHTHAGVDVLRRRLRSLGASTSSFDVETIAGWTLRYALAFPKSSGQQIQQPNTDDDWKQIYTACGRLFQSRGIREVIRASYSGVYVDEYQDCTVEQHELICQLSAILACRILGDPLQGIFNFRNSELVDWDLHIEPHFNKLPELSDPWRWKNTAPLLGNWLLRVRADLLSGKQIDLRTAPNAEVKWIQLPADPRIRYTKQIAALKEVAKNSGNVIGIMQWENQCNKFVNALSPLYNNIETVACDALMSAAEHIHEQKGIARMGAVVAFASECLTGINASTKTIVAALQKGGPARKQAYTRQAEMDLLAQIIATPSLDAVLPALEGLRRIPGTKVWRKELFYEMRRALREYATSQYPDLKSAAWAVRNKTRHVERKLGSRVVSRTLLVKGLEFDHCIIMDADSLTVRNLYVAMTRGSRSLTILSKSQILNPKASIN